ncbi:DNA-binding response regulator, OmpR family, contains REC and winged-helix (wHTH) domain [Amycolatopsis tolypomycina]|uniref:DNA-binding response regulator, OmpR family, contains REC and winged-helix (WHTH) domain n=1 Tax=Amycolatopsis tolypomycina TaxID=208445 RepID=A0A1H5BP03_9PSEU|nr:response regulator transcription factor [Amycolatopsis tolypomycina]SED56145.1 DNA-binding response regulator, OmpR family, contains REC and winged-helix (wHTH) domain [Amycolatopsis tolypomycina]
MRILLVEDERRLADALRAGLEAEGYAVDVAHNGRDALWFAGEHPYAALVLDVMLPGLNGFRVCRRLRELGNRTPILMLTAKDGEDDEIEALDTGADDFLAKPFSYGVLLSRLRALIRRGGATRAGVLRVGDLELDQAGRTCRRGVVDIALTGKEFALLAYLMQRPGQVVTKAELVDNLWDFAASATANLVEVHVSALRRKIDVPFGAETIRTVRGAGYHVTSA